MIPLLEEAFSEASKLSEKEQESLGAWILEELASERRWTEAFANSESQLSVLADEALTEHREGRSLEMDPNVL